MRPPTCILHAHTARAMQHYSSQATTATYRLEHGYLPSLPVVVGLDILAIVTINLRQLGRHPLFSFRVVVFARGRRQGGFGRSVVMLGSRRRLDRLHDIGGGFHVHGAGAGAGCKSQGRRDAASQLAGEVRAGAGAAQSSAMSPPGSGVAESRPQQFFGRRIDGTESSEQSSSDFSGCGAVGERYCRPCCEDRKNGGA